MDVRRIWLGTARTSAALLVLGCCLFATTAAWALTPARGALHYARLRHACPPAQGARASCFAVVRVPVAASAASSAGVRSYSVPGGSLTAGPAGGLTPAALASAYGFGPTGGAGQTVAVVDAFDDPKIEEDLAAFDLHYGLPECTTTNGCFRKVNAEGTESGLPATDKIGWSQEISLDVETVRAVCRGCRILLVQASSAQYKDLAKAVDEAVKLGATEVSNSYGGPEVGMEPGAQAAYDHPGVVITAATGDLGYDNWNYPLLRVRAPGMPSAPASLPTVVSVGGTSLYLNGEGQRLSETVWNDDGIEDVNGLPAGYVTGGGCSTLFEAERWQRNVAGFPAAGCGSRRLAADVSADGDPLTGFDIYDTYNFCGTGTECKELKEAIERFGGWQTFGGTSLSTPMVASLYALAGGSAGVSYPALSLYGHLGDASSLYDVTQGGNGFCAAQSALLCGEPNRELGETLDCEGTSSCDARSGYDGPSGVGTPNGLGAFRPLLPTAVVTPPPVLAAGFPAAFGSAASSDPYPGGNITGWSWGFGDGGAGSSQGNPAHTYAAPGDYTVSLTVTDQYGLSSVVAKQPVHVRTEAEGRHEREEEAANNKHEEEAAATKRHEEEAAAAKRHEEEAATTKRHEEEAAATKRHEEEAAAASRQAEGVTPGTPPQTGAQGISPFQAVLAAAVPDAELATASLRVSASGAVKIRISCPVRESRCVGRVTLRTLSAVKAGGAQVSRTIVLTLASGTFTVGGGGVGVVTLHLSPRASALLTRSRALRARATIVAHDPQGASHTAQTVVTLHAPRARRR